MQANMDLSVVGETLESMGPNVLAIASKRTGGLHMNTFKHSSIEHAMYEIGGELSTQYILGYGPSDNERPGYHEIRVEVNRPGDTVRTRPGYYLAPSP